MKVRFYAPFDKITGREAEFDIQEKVTLRQFIGVLRRKYPDLAPYLVEEDKSHFTSYIFVVRNGASLGLDDAVGDGDILSILLPATGG